MRRLLVIFFLVLFFITVLLLSRSIVQKQVIHEVFPNTYWLLLHRKSNKEYLYQGIPGNQTKSYLIRIFRVKTGIPGERPTPLPQLLGRDYWLIIEKHSEKNSETAPYFLTLNIPASKEAPFGPVPYRECKGQCNWVTPGNFGLHGVGGNEGKLLASNPGSSGCIRHRDEDISYLYTLLDPVKKEIRYYVVDL
jgi:hypothetical protein